MWGRVGLAGRQNGGGGGGGGGGGDGEDRSDEALGNGTQRDERDRQRGSEGGRATDGLLGGGGGEGRGGEEGEGSNLPPHHDPHQGKDLPPHQEMGQLSVQVRDLLR